MIRAFSFFAATAWLSTTMAPTTIAAPINRAEFMSMRYEGSDPAQDVAPLVSNQFRNPILPGFQPDPSIVRVGSDYYLVNSSFGWLPGIPIYHSRDLVNWRQIGNAIPGATNGGNDFKLPSVGINRGIFAPTIRWHQGVYYIITTCIECGGNFLITARNPGGPWSKPVWLKSVTGIDPDLFFDDDGRAWITNNDAPDGPAAYDGHRALWIQEYDVQTRTTIGPRKVLVDRGVIPADKPVWSEGPHIFKKDGTYYLTAAEGGTSDDHRQTIYRSSSVTGPYTPGPNNPILTQRNLDPARPLPVYAAGHADFVQLPGGDWWAVFLATRPYERNLTNLGRETFLLPVTWSDGWPTILSPGKAVPLMLTKPKTATNPQVPNWSTWYDPFEGTKLGPQWLARRSITPDWLTLDGKTGSLFLNGTGTRFIGQRLRHRNATITTEIRYAPITKAGRAGLAAIVDEGHQLVFAIKHRPTGASILVSATGQKGSPAGETILVEKPLNVPAGATIKMRMTITGGAADFAYALPNQPWITILSDADARLLATEYDGLLFTGTVIGLYASD